MKSIWYYIDLSLILAIAPTYLNNNQKEITLGITADKFIYIGNLSNPAVTDLENTGNWEVTLSLGGANHGNEVIYAVQILGNITNYVDDNGTPTDPSDDVLKVNCPGTLQTDILDAAGKLTNPIHEITTIDYSITTQALL